MNNENLCYVNTIQWKTIVDTGVGIIVESNRRLDECENDDMICDSECSDEGCWGPGPDKCRSCRNFKLGDKCVEECNTVYTPRCSKACPITMFESNGNCLPCDDQCSGCYGPTASECIHCKYLNNNSTCVQTCPLKKYAHQNIDCLPCPDKCVIGCLERVRNGTVDCNDCMRIDQEGRVIKCSRKTCPSSYFDSTNTTERIQNEVTCSLCHVECNECYGPGPNYCKACKNVTIYKSEKLTSSYKNFTCTSQFVNPTDYPHCVKEPKVTSTVHCYKKVDEEISFIYQALFLTTSVVIALILFWLISYKCNKKLYRKVRQYNANIEDESRLLGEHNMMSQSIEKDFERGGTITKGTFYKNDTYGKLYLGCQNNSQSVVIKILYNHIFKHPKKIKKEMDMLSSLKHIYLFEVKFEIWEGSTIMVITQEMPLGNLQDYIRNNRIKIKPIDLLKWCKQTAEGMAYLEMKDVVHGDLAARTLMLHVDGNVKIKDFGFIYLLDTSKQKISALKRYKEWQALEYQADNPIFTHKTDVWAFGVTAWELLTFGKDPRDFITFNRQNFRDDLDKGIRLPCPQISKDVTHKFLSKCWYIVPEKRPSFAELLKTLIQMTYKPNEYIITTGIAQRTLSKPKRHRHPSLTCYY